MQANLGVYTTKGILASLGYNDPWKAARQQARMILLGRLARYQAEIKQLEKRWDCTLGDLRARYETQGSEEFTADDDYLRWQWYADAVEAISAQLQVLGSS